MKIKSIALFAAAGLLMISCGEKASNRVENANPSSTPVVSETPASTPEVQPVQTNQTNNIDPSVVDTDGTPVFSFDKESHDFGQIEQGTKAETVFKFTNTGDAPLIITSAKGSCGCTVPDWPNEPIAPGETSEIAVSFDSNGRQGKQQKSVTITANTTPNTKVLTITSEVMVPSAE